MVEVFDERPTNGILYQSGDACLGNESEVRLSSDFDFLVAMKDFGSLYSKTGNELRNLKNDWLRKLVKLDEFRACPAIRL